MRPRKIKLRKPIKGTSPRGVPQKDAPQKDSSPTDAPRKAAPRNPRNAPQRKNKEIAGLPARRIALAILIEVLEKKQQLDLVLAASRNLAALEKSDRAFVRLLVATVLRRKGQIDDLIKSCLDKPIPEDAPALRHVLRLGIAQLLFVKTPSYAAINTSVELTKIHKLPGFSGLVNAVLRRLMGDGNVKIEAQDAARLNAPPWLWDSWVKTYGSDVASAIAEAHLNEAPLDISVKSDIEGWAEKLGATLLPTGTLRRRAGGMVEELSGFDKGEWWVQDAAAALPVKIMGDVKDVEVLDLCAAPGGKLMQLIAAGAKATAVDLSSKRIQTLQENLNRVGMTAELVSADAAEFAPGKKFAKILLDAPCSATGTIRRHPDIGWLKSKEDVLRLQAAQKRIAENAVRLLSPGGTLVYAVCSLEAEEGPEVIAHILQQFPEMRRLPVKPSEIADLGDLVTADGDIRTLPCDLSALGGMDGFYIARLQRLP